MSDLSATQCGCGGLSNGSGCSSCVWIILLLLLCGNNNGSGLFGDNCGGGCDCIWIILILLFCCGNNGSGYNNGCGC